MEDLLNSQRKKSLAHTTLDFRYEGLFSPHDIVRPLRPGVCSSVGVLTQGSEEATPRLTTHHSNTPWVAVRYE